MLLLFWIDFNSNNIIDFLPVPPASHSSLPCSPPLDVEASLLSTDYFVAVVWHEGGQGPQRLGGCLPIHPGGGGEEDVWLAGRARY